MGKLPYIHSYDIRGIFERDFDDKTIQDIAKAMMSEFLPQTVLIGYDMRLTSEHFFEVFSKTFTDYGVQVKSIGLASTPQMYFASCVEDCDLGIIITASHNPKEYNGMKVCRRNAIPISYDTGLDQVERRIMDQLFDVVKSDEKGEIVNVDITQKYEDCILSYTENVESLRPLKIAIDYANAIGCYSNIPILKKLEEKKLIECVNLYDELDGTFPNHEANPLKEELYDDLKQLVKDEKCDFGVCFDGDSDRVGFIDNLGNYIAPDVVGCFLVDYFANYKKDFSSFCYDLRSTHNLIKVGNEYHKKFEKTRVGHSHIKKVMHESGAEFACELSGHFYFDQSGSKYDDALRALIEVICAFVKVSQRSFADEMRFFKPKYKSPETNFKVDDVVKKVEESRGWFTHFGDCEMDTLDGITYEFKDFWINIRKSNTEPVLRVNYEITNDSKDLYDEITDLIYEKLS